MAKPRKISLKAYQQIAYEFTCKRGATIQPGMMVELDADTENTVKPSTEAHDGNGGLRMFAIEDSLQGRRADSAISDEFEYKNTADTDDGLKFSKVQCRVFRAGDKVYARAIAENVAGSIKVHSYLAPNGDGKLRVAAADDQRIAVATEALAGASGGAKNALIPVIII